MSLIHRSTKFRKRNLKAYITEIHGRIEFVAEFEAKTAKDVREKMDEIMANRGEGLVMKHPEAEYVLDGRNRDWIKASFSETRFVYALLTWREQVKPEYMVCSPWASEAFGEFMPLHRIIWERLSMF